MTDPSTDHDRTDPSTDHDATCTETNWAVDYDVDPIRIRDPVAEALGVLPPGDPFVISYRDVVTAAGHSCPTAAGAFRIAQLGLDALYPAGLPVRSEIAVLAAGPRDDATYGLLGRLLSYVTGASGATGFGGLAGGYGDRRDLLTFDAFEVPSAAPTFRLRRTDTGDAISVTYHVSDVPGGGPAIGNLQAIIDGDATRAARDAFADAWHGRVRAVLSDESLFTVEAVADD